MEPFVRWLEPLQKHDEGTTRATIVAEIAVITGVLGNAKEMITWRRSFAA